MISVKKATFKLWIRRKRVTWMRPMTSLSLHDRQAASLQATPRGLKDNTDFPAYSDTGNSETPVTVTVLSCPNWPFIYKKGCG